MKEKNKERVRRAAPQTFLHRHIKVHLFSVYAASVFTFRHREKGNEVMIIVRLAEERVLTRTTRDEDEMQTREKCLTSP